MTVSAPPGLKRCPRCREHKPFDAFGVNKQVPSGLGTYCLACRREWWRTQYRDDPERFRKDAKWRTVKHRYGLSKSEYETLLESQSGVCAICKEQPSENRLCIDHDHNCCSGIKTCGKCIRELLCSRCNKLLGMVNDNPQLLEEATRYLRKWSPSL